ncbi:MAG: vanadium-dependent haloperoxidase [Verrucomicrobia bacterium]|nr:vanadium-dependent haloperoxidase [Verrucomicrobiota bacterium]
MPAAGGADPESALHGAAREILLRLFPCQSAQINAAAAAQPPTDPVSAAWGANVAAVHFKDRETDGSKNEVRYEYQNTAGAYQHDPEHPEGCPPQPVGPNWGMVKLFGIANMIALSKPPGYLGQGRINRSDPEYLLDYKRVKKDGHVSNISNTSTPASLNNALVGLYWAYDGVPNLGTPPRLYFQIIETVANGFNLSERRRMMLYMICGTSLGDAGIHAWYWKYHYNIWRPVTGIRHHGESFGDDSQTTAHKSTGIIDGDPFWQPLGAPRTNGTGKNFTPPFPAYPSGHATFGGASLHALRHILNTWYPNKVKLKDRSDKVSFDFVSDELNGINRDVSGAVTTRHKRHFDSIEDAINENGLSRVFLGVHWVFDAELKKPGKTIGGVPLGIEISEELCKTYAASISAV